MRELAAVADGSGESDVADDEAGDAGAMAAAAPAAESAAAARVAAAGLAGPGDAAGDGGAAADGGPGDAAGDGPLPPLPQVDAELEAVVAAPPAGKRAKMQAELGRMNREQRWAAERTAWSCDACPSPL
mmetsp:Transcript_68422/g.187546  ORF Transcript_68422/g.187546 Transcript_68422/m.187546 type:complete len:129 (-) Transcript_68422:30-416(-)